MRRRVDQLDPMLAPPMRDQFTRAEEAQYDADQRFWETDGAWLLDLGPDDEDPAA